MIRSSRQRCRAAGRVRRGGAALAQACGALLLAVLAVFAAAGPASAQSGHDDRIAAILADQQAAAGRIVYGSTSQYQLIAGQTHSALSAYALQAIGSNPAAAQPVMSAIARLAPDFAAPVAQTVVATFPGLTTAIYGAVGLVAPAPVPVAQAFPTHSGFATAPRATGQFAIAAPAQGGYTAPPSDLNASQAATRAIQQIAENPAWLTRAVQTAIASAPGRAQEVTGRIASAFPGFAPQIYQAASGAPPPQAAPPAPGGLALRQAPATLQTGQPAALPAARTAPVAGTLTSDYGTPRLVQRAPGRQRTARAGLADLPRTDAPRRPEIEGEGASLEPEIPGGEVIRDPLEPMNRVFHALNDTLDVVLLRPIAWLYNKLVPDPVINAIGRAFDNLGEPVIFLNDLLQFDFADAGTAAGRFAINSTVGVLGLFDFADDFGLERHNADFGQTLHSYGSPPGPYLVLPLLGPSTMRDALGRVVDTAMDPRTYLLQTSHNAIIAGGNAVVQRERVLEPLDDLKSGSLDYYAALKAAYYQRRALELRKGRADPNQGRLDSLFDEAEDDPDQLPSLDSPRGGRQDNLQRLPSVNTPRGGQQDGLQRLPTLNTPAATGGQDLQRLPRLENPPGTPQEDLRELPRLQTPPPSRQNGLDRPPGLTAPPSLRQ